MVSVIALAHDRDKNLDFTMKCWVEQTYKDFELNIFESGNLDSTIEILQKYKKHVKINCWRLHTKYVNKTFALNFLAKQSLGDFISVWDVDLLKSKNFLFECLNNYNEKDVLVEYAKYMNNHITNWTFDRNLNYEQIIDLENNWPTFFSCADAPSQLFISKNDYFALGGYDERFFGWGSEDRDFLERIIRYGKNKKITTTWSYHLEHSIKNNYQNTAFSNKNNNQKLYLENKKMNVTYVDNSKISWDENLWDINSKPTKIEL